MYFFLYLGFFVRLEARFFVPTRSFHTLSRAGAVKVGRRSDISSAPAMPITCLTYCNIFLD
jgi:hypothetical protein